MKNLFYTFCLSLFMVGCYNSKRNFTLQKAILTDTVAVEDVEIYYDTLIKTSEPFEFNELFCFWEHTLIIADYGVSEVFLKLKEQPSQRIILEDNTNVRYPEDFDYKAEDYFDIINNRYFEDVNFDGYKDFVIYSHGSMPMTSMTNITIFDKQTHTFNTESDTLGWYLSDNSIEVIDPYNRTLTTSSFDWEKMYMRIHHFDKEGNVKFSENSSEEYYEPERGIPKMIVTYAKIVNGKEVETRIDTLNISEE